MDLRGFYRGIHIAWQTPGQLGSTWAAGLLGSFTMHGSCACSSVRARLS